MVAHLLSVFSSHPKENLDDPLPKRQRNNVIVATVSYFLFKNKNVVAAPTSNNSHIPLTFFMFLPVKRILYSSNKSLKALNSLL